MKRCKHLPLLAAACWRYRGERSICYFGQLATNAARFEASHRAASIHASAHAPRSCAVAPSGSAGGVAQGSTSAAAGGSILSGLAGAAGGIVEHADSVIVEAASSKICSSTA